MDRACVPSRLPSEWSSQDNSGSLQPTSDWLPGHDGHQA